MDPPPVGERIARRIAGEYRELPGLRLTLAQAQRLWSLDRRTCESLLASLVERSVLLRTPEGIYVRADPSPAGRVAPSPPH
jgi:hypothetical protein